ncbi:Pentatricopeptide repeat-containing protein [Arachis hypogaea]|nr:Pentatricopeptide repeat-containing protein [Arachis hypogaea]
MVKKVCSLVCDSYHNQSHVRVSSPRLNLVDIDPDSLTHEQALTIVASLASDAGSMVALSFFNWATVHSKFRNFMRFYIVCATSVIGNGNTEKAHEVLQCMVKNFAEIGKVKDAVEMVIEMHNQGLVPSTRTLNCVIKVTCEMGFVEYAEYLFEEMCVRGVHPNSASYRLMVIAYCRIGKILEADRWLHAMLERGFMVDNATFTLVISKFCEKGVSNRAMWYFRKLSDMGLKPNLINYTCMIEGLCKRGSIKQAFEMLEEMVGKGWKPNVYTHTALIDGLCKKGWTEKAFRLFLKLVRSENHKPNVHTYTAMISGYCKDEKLNRAEMLLNRMREQGLVPNTNTYTALIDGHCKAGNFERAYELLNLMNNDGFSPNICTYNAIVDGLCKKGRVKEAYKILRSGFHNGLEADKVTYTILISEHCNQAEIKQALVLFNKMVKIGIQPDIHSYTTLIAVLCREKRMRESEMFFEEALKVGLIPTKKTYTSMICGYCREGNLNLAMRFFHRMSDSGCVPDSITYGAIISGLCKQSRLDEARGLYDSMLEKGLVPCEVTRVSLAYEYCKIDDGFSAMAVLEKLEKKLWIRTANTLVRKLCSEKKVGLAALLFHKLLDIDLQVNRVTLAAFMTACYESNKCIEEMLSAVQNQCLLLLPYTLHSVLHDCTCIITQCYSSSSPQPTLSPSQSSLTVKKFCSLLVLPPRLNLVNIHPDSLTHEQGLIIVASLASDAGSMVALRFFNWAYNHEMDRWSGILRVQLHSKSKAFHRVGASLCLSPETRTLSVPEANAIFFCGDRVEGTGNQVIERLSDLQKLSEIVVSKFGSSINAWVIQASVFNGPFAVYKDFIPSVNQYGEPRSYQPTGFPASTSTVSLLSNCLEEVRKVISGTRGDTQSGCSRRSSVSRPKTFILGFSKGGTVVNQIVTELGSTEIASDANSPCSGQPEETCIVPKAKESLLNSITEIHYVDVGLNSTGAYLTNHHVFERITRRLIQGAPQLRFILHGTPRQWGNKQRDWIRNEKDEMLRLLESEAHKSEGKLKVHSRYYFADKPPDMQMHFEIIESLDVS